MVWEYNGIDGEDRFLLVLRGLLVSQLDDHPAIKAMQNELEGSIVGRDQLDRSLPPQRHRRWFPTVFRLGEELFQIKSIFPFDNFFALSCDTLDGSCDSDQMHAAVAAVNAKIRM